MPRAQPTLKPQRTPADDAADDAADDDADDDDDATRLFGIQHCLCARVFVMNWRTDGPSAGAIAQIRWHTNNYMPTMYNT